MTMMGSPDRPDPDSPFEYWRWCLLADRLGMHAPEPRGTDIETLAAEHYALLWQVGMEQLASRSHRLAERCRDLLVQTCLDENRPFAAWITDPQQIGAL